MAEGDLFKASVIMEGSLGTAFVFDFGYFDSSSGSGHVDTGTAAGDFQNLVQSTLAAALPDTQEFVRYRFACVGPATSPYKGEVGWVEVDPRVPGDRSPTSILPCEICVSMKRNTGHVGRGDRGRVFFGAVDSAFRDATNADKVLVPSTELGNVSDLLKATLTTQTRVLKPCFVKADGTSNGRQIINTSYGVVFVHRKSRRFRVGV